MNRPEGSGVDIHRTLLPADGAHRRGGVGPFLVPEIDIQSSPARGVRKGDLVHTRDVDPNVAVRPQIQSGVRSGRFLDSGQQGNVSGLGALGIGGVNNHRLSPIEGRVDEGDINARRRTRKTRGAAGGGGTAGAGGDDLDVAGIDQPGAALSPACRPCRQIRRGGQCQPTRRGFHEPAPPGTATGFDGAPHLCPILGEDQDAAAAAGTVAIRPQG